jgi:hypothetical protein
MTDTKLTDLQQRADTVQAAHDSLKDGGKVLSDNIIRDLLHYAELGARSYAEDQTIFHHVTSAHHESRRLKDLQTQLWNRQLQINQQVDEIRRYHGYETRQALIDAINAGKRAPVPVAPTPTVHVVTKAQQEHDSIIAKARERAAEANAAQEAAKETK